MIRFDLDPIIIRLGHLQIGWYGVFMALGIGVAVWLTALEAKRRGILPDAIYDGALWVVIGGIVGARLFHVIDNWSMYAANPAAIFGTAGLAIYGALIGGLIAVVIYTSVRQLPLWRILDAAAPAIPLAQAIARIGCFINGDNYGVPTNPSLPWSVTWTNPNAMVPDRTVAYQPAQLYEGVWDLIVFAIIWRLRTRVKTDGVLFLVYAALYSFGRFFISFVRVDNLYFANLRQAQIIALAVMALAIPLALWLNGRHTGRMVSHL
ncbi:MAG: prolipoprotein diacylglyceryl transferase [Anaerolineae bacterium]|nr:prolipoprotein diacylglyceryl transferase [Anaerolineae bacterium]